MRLAQTHLVLEVNDSTTGGTPADTLTVPYTTDSNLYFGNIPNNNLKRFEGYIGQYVAWNIILSATQRDNFLRPRDNRVDVNDAQYRQHSSQANNSNIDYYRRYMSQLLNMQSYKLYTEAAENTPCATLSYWRRWRITKTT